MPVLPGGLQAEEVVESAGVDELEVDELAAEELESGQHWLLASPGQ